MIKEGIINVNKPAGMSSHDVVYTVRKLVGVRRIGHTGTLDPQAKGVLPVCIGTATRVPEYMDQDLKTYRCSMLLGVSSDTQDIWGKEVVDRRAEIGEISEAQVRSAFAGFKGVIAQVPPKYSAVWVNGRRLYDYARSGQEVEIPVRTIYIDKLDIEEIDLAEKKITFSVTCSKGTYIRTICADVGDKLGCGAAMCELTRVRSGFCSIETAVDYDQLKSLADKRAELIEKLPKTQKMPRGRMNDAEILLGGIDVLAKLYGAEGPVDIALRQEFEALEAEINALMIGPDEVLHNFGKAIVHTKELCDWFTDGGHVRMSEVDIIEEPRFAKQEFPLEMRDEFRRSYRLYSPERVFLGVAYYDLKYKKLVPDKVFYRRMEK